MIFDCPEKWCFYYVYVKDQDAYDKAKTTHKCPYPGGTRTYGPEYTMSLLSEIWDELDRTVEYLKEQPQADDHEFKKAYALGLSYTLAKFMVPYFRTTEEVSREALKRYKNRKEGVAYDSPGLGSLKYVPPVEAPQNKYPELYAREVPARKKTSAPRSATAVTRELNEKELHGIRNGKGFFPAADVARMYSIPEAQVEEIWATV